MQLAPQGLITTKTSHKCKMYSTTPTSANKFQGKCTSRLSLWKVTYTIWFEDATMHTRLVYPICSTIPSKCFEFLPQAYLQVCGPITYWVLREKLYLDGIRIPWPMNGLNSSRRKPPLVIPNANGITKHYGLPLTTSNTHGVLELF